MDFRIFLLYLITFLDLFAVGLVVPLISAHVSSLGGSHFVVGLMGSCYSGLQLFSGPLLGSLSDIKGRKPVLIATLLCCSASYLCFGCVSSIYLLLLLRMILGIFKHTQTLAKAFVTDVIDNTAHSDVYGKMAAISGVGITFGPLIGGHIVEDYPDFGFFVACTVASVLFIVNAGLVYIIESNTKKSKSKATKKDKKHLNYIEIAMDSWKKSVEELKSVNWHEYWDIFLLKGLVGFSLSIFYSNYSPLLKNYYQLSPKWIGYTISFQGIIGALCSFFIKYINTTFYSNDTNYSQRNLHSFVLLTLTFFGLIMCNQWILFVILLVPLAVGNAILRLVTLEVVIQKAPENQRGSLIGASNSVRSISGIIGPFVAGSISDLLGIEYVMTVSLLSTLIGSIVSMKQKQAESKKNVSKKKVN